MLVSPPPAGMNAPPPAPPVARLGASRTSPPPPRGKLWERRIERLRKLGIDV